MKNINIETLKSAVLERQVEDVYNEALKKYLNVSTIEYPFQCDGFIKFNNHSLLIEYKLDENLSNVVSRAKVLCQVLYYLKKFKQNGKRLPEVIFVADKNECFVMHSNQLLKYLDFKNVDWTKAPCNADLVKIISEDKKINPFIFDVNDELDFSDVVKKIKAIATNTVCHIRIIEHIVKIGLDWFNENVLKEKNYSTIDLVTLFFNVITGSNDVYLHPVKTNCLVSNGKELRVNSKMYKEFCTHFSIKCSPLKRKRFASISDRLIEDMNRCVKGEFYPPIVLVDYAHQMIAKQFGENWKDEYVVWDCACSTKNLTRDYNFKELYSSTLEQGELEISKKYNTNSAAFQFDFLNDELKRISEGGKCPDSLINSLEANKPIIFYINPPYRRSTGTTIRFKGVKKYTFNTQINKQMIADKIAGFTPANLYTQFLYRITKIKQQYNLTNCNIAVFCPQKFISNQITKVFRDYWFANFEFNTGIQFDTNHFADVLFGAMLFTIWKTGIQTNTNEITVDQVDNVDGELSVIGKKSIYNLDNKLAANDWIKQGITNKDKVESVCCSSGLVIKDNLKSNSISGSLGVFVSHGNNIFESTQYNTCIFTMGTYIINSIPITPENFDKVVTYFTARLVCIKNLYNQSDEFSAPNTTHAKWNEFVADSIVYSLFNSKSQQTSLRNITYHNKQWNIPNEFFFVSQKDMIKWANENNVAEVFDDANNKKESFVYTKLIEHFNDLSKEAKDVLHEAMKLVKKSMNQRVIFNKECPETQILNWDCGWYQIKKLLKAYMPDELKNFNSLYKKLADKLNPMVYELEFLKK